MRRTPFALGVWLTFWNAVTAAHAPPLLPAHDVAVLANELSGETAKRNLEGLARLHRQRASEGFHAAAELIAERARSYGLSDVEILRFAADGSTAYGTQRARLAWDADAAELSEIRSEGTITLASYGAEPIVLAEDSESADVTAGLIDVGEGTRESDYAGRDVRGQLVLVGGQPGAVQDLAIAKFGAAGIVSYAQNQKTAWSGENENLIRWGHLQSFSQTKTFAFMVSLRTARLFSARLKAGESIRLHAHVEAGQHPGYYEVVTAVIPGSDPTLKEQEIAFSCHLDHQRPGANDNASGCVTILEVGRALQKLIGNGTLPRPARSIRFIWPPEIEGTLTLLNARPEFAERIKAVIHLDMVGGSPATKAVFHITRGPASLPSFVHDIAWGFAAWINRETYDYAATGSAEYPLVAPEGGKEPLGAAYSSYTMGSDHDVYQDSSFGIPTIYMNDWPDRYIHTNGDSAANIDTTKLKRAGLIGAASGYFLAGFSARDRVSTDHAMAAGKLQRAVTALERAPVDPESAARSQTLEDAYESAVVASRNAFLAGMLPGHRPAARPVLRRVAGAGALVFQRATAPKGPLTVFGYDYFSDHAEAAGLPTPKLLGYAGAWGEGGEYAYEALNLADGRHTAQQICDALSLEFGPVPLGVVIEYLRALQTIGLVEAR